MTLKVSPWAAEGEVVVAFENKWALLCFGCHSVATCREANITLCQRSILSAECRRQTALWSDLRRPVLTCEDNVYSIIP